MQKDRIYVCHTFYHAYVACLKELNLPKDQQGGATLVLSKMSNNFATFPERAKKSGLFAAVIEFDEKDYTYFPELVSLKKDRGNLVLNMLQRMKFCKRLGELEAPFVPVDFSQYRDIYVFCDSDPIGYYLSCRKIYYHAVEDGLNCIRYRDTARDDNRGHFALKAKMAALGLIFIQNGYGKYCIDFEVNDISVLDHPIPKMREVPREALVAHLSDADRALLSDMFIETGRCEGPSEDPCPDRAPDKEPCNQRAALSGPHQGVRDHRREARRHRDQAPSEGSPRLSEGLPGGCGSRQSLPDGDPELYGSLL